MSQISQHGLLEAVQVNIDVGVDGLGHVFFRVSNLSRDAKRAGGGLHGLVRLVDEGCNGVQRSFYGYVLSFRIDWFMAEPVHL